MKGLVVVVAAFASVARAGAPFPNLPPAHMLVTSVVATSTLADPHDAYAAWRALAYETRDGPDMDNPTRVPTLWSAWCEGKPDEGIGETLTITLAEPTQLDAIRIAAGVWRTDALFRANNQPTKLEVTLDGGKPIAVAPKGKTWTELGVHAKVTTIAIRIAAVKKARMNDSCIAGIDLMRGGDSLTPLIGIEPKAWAELPKALAEIQRILGSDARKGLERWIEFPFSSHDLLGDYGGYGGSQTAIDKSWPDLVAACKTYDAARKAKGDDYMWIDPLGCPQPANYDPGDSRNDALATPLPGVLTVSFPSHKEAGIRWTLSWTDRWRLSDIDEDTY